VAYRPWDEEAEDDAQAQTDDRFARFIVSASAQRVRDGVQTDAVGEEGLLARPPARSAKGRKARPSRSTMPRPISLDLQRRIVAAIEQGARSARRRRFAVSASAAIKLVQPRHRRYDACNSSTRRISTPGGETRISLKARISSAVSSPGPPR
jgi:hypothetical protein